MIDAASKIVARVYTRKRLADAAGINKRKVTAAISSAAFALLFLLLMYFAIDTDSLILEIISYCSIGVSFILILPLALYECFRKSDYKLLNFN